MKHKNNLSKKISGKHTNNKITKKNKHQNNTEKISIFLKNIKSKISTKVPYKFNLMKNGTKNINTAGQRISELGSQMNCDFGQMFFYDMVHNAMRVPHWHSNGDEIGLVLDGKIRITMWNGIECEKLVFTVEKMGTWFIPKGALHCLENIGNNETKFLVCYNNPNTADRDFLNAWETLPIEIICSSTFLSLEDAKIIKSQQINNRLTTFEPTHFSEKINHLGSFSNNLNVTEPIYSSALGEMRKVGPNNTVNMKLAWQKTVLKPGSLRLPHWYTNSDVLVYVLKGEAYVSMLDSIGNGSNEIVYNFTISAGEVLSIKSGFFHCFLNIKPDEDFEYYEAFMSGDTTEITLLKGIQSLSSGVASGALGLSKEHSSAMLKYKAPEFIVKF